MTNHDRKVERKAGDAPDLAFGHTAAAEIAAAVRGIMWRDMAVLGLRAHAAWQMPEQAPADARLLPRPFDVQALNLARSLASLGLALKRASAKDVCEAPADTLAAATLSHLDVAFTRAVTAERRVAVEHSPRTHNRDPHLEFERRIFPHAPDRWSDEARAEVGLPPVQPAARNAAELAHARWVIQQQTAEVARLEAETASFEAEVTALERKMDEIEVRMAEAEVEGLGKDGAPRPLASRRRH
ncbi:hypothetical protein sos41_23340 [Alphaproteobacteria bacterium SO-S41]|nr:hypothetical protein sos41_23340 [Alphaproteobacteria bacterium SO-S41]